MEIASRAAPDLPPRAGVTIKVGVTQALPGLAEVTVVVPEVVVVEAVVAVAAAGISQTIRNSAATPCELIGGGKA